VPGEADELANSVRIDWFPDVTVAGLKDAETPVGRFVALSAML
jgi:hypothetical protein